MEGRKKWKKMAVKVRTEGNGKKKGMEWNGGKEEMEENGGKGK